MPALIGADEGEAEFFNHAAAVVVAFVVIDVDAFCVQHIEGVANGGIRGLGCVALAALGERAPIPRGKNAVAIVHDTAHYREFSVVTRKAGGDIKRPFGVQAGGEGLHRALRFLEIGRAHV